MTEATTRATRITTAAVGVVVAGVVALTAFGFARAGGPGDQGATPAPAETTAVATPAPTDAAPTPQPTTSAPLESTAPIRTDLTATVTSAKAVTAKATQPGEVGGPSVRFAIRLTNRTGKAISLADTVVNAYYGADKEPGYPLTSGAKAFPSSVAAGKSVSGVFVFQVPEDERDVMSVTIDTSTANPVVAFTGAGPR